MSFKQFVKGEATTHARNYYQRQQPMLSKSTETDTGEAEVTKLNSDGTVDVKLNGNTISNVNPGSKGGLGVGASVVVVAGKTLVR